MSGLKTLLIGGGGREHALAWAIAQSPRIAEIVCAPGNGGIAPLGRCVPVSQKDLNDLLRVVVAEQPDLTIVGPEVPLALGLVDELQRRSLAAFGPTRVAAALETSKSFAKRFMQRHSIPTARYAVCANEAEALQTLEHFHLPLVVKADGLQAGKGVLLCETRREVEEAVRGLFSGRLLGAAETSIVIEEFLKGEEISFLVLSDGKHVTPLVPAQDHKRIGEGDTGLNTGGMGVYSSDAMLAPEMRDWILHHIAQPTIDGMAAEETPFVGVLFIGLMMTALGPMVLEYNTRFGDPETQAIVMRLDSDLLEGMAACVEGRLSETEFRWRSGASACVIAASAGYPGSYTSGARIHGLDQAASLAGVQVFHAGTALLGSGADAEYLTAGGRVLGVAAAGLTLNEALGLAYEGMEKIHFEGMYYRRDIGHLARKKNA